MSLSYIPVLVNVKSREGLSSKPFRDPPITGRTTGDGTTLRVVKSLAGATKDRSMVSALALCAPPCMELAAVW